LKLVISSPVQPGSFFPMENQMHEPILDHPTGIRGRTHLHQRYSDPFAVVADPEMSSEDKRAMLADWASDARAVCDHPALRQLDNGVVVDIDRVLSALKRLDGIQTDQSMFGTRSHNSKHLGTIADEERRPLWKFWDDDDDDPPPCPSAAVPWRPRPMLDATRLMAA
jgi:hypothetical protein